MNIPIFHPSSERVVKIKVARIFKKLDEKPKVLPELKDDDYQAFKDDLASHATYDALKNDEIENPFNESSY